MLTIAITILSTEEIQILITVLTILLIEEITVLTQTIHPILLQEPLERAAITTQILTALHVQEAIATLLVDLILQVLQVEVCVPQEAAAEVE